jgi:translation initiation factor eIF-2B subunit epsilon
VPLIEYTLEFLASNGVQEVFVYCGAHSQKIENYIHESPRWNPASTVCPFSKLDFIRVSDANSIGDFLRDLDKRAIITGDFILVHGDLVANIQLDNILAKHRARREANRDACMTIVLRSVGDQPHRMARARGINPVFVIESSTGRCLQYGEIHPLQTNRKFKIEPYVFEHDEFEVRTDLIDCGIDICTPDVLALWSEGFDYELPRKNFLHGVLKDWELNGKIISAEILDAGYAARATNLQTYDCISQDVLQRWTMPFVPDTNLVHGYSYKRAKDGNYVEDHVVLERGSRVTKCAVGRSTTVKTGSVISKSIIGRRCRIGKNVRIEDSYIWDDAVIADGASVIHSVVANGAVVGANAQVPAGSLISYHVQLADGVGLPRKPPARISNVTDDRQPALTDESLVGRGGKGALYTVPRDEEDSDDEGPRDGDPSVIVNSLIYSLDIPASSVSSFDSDRDMSDLDSDDEDGFSAAGSVSTGGGFGGEVDEFGIRHESHPSTSSSQHDGFHNDAVNGLVDALRDTTTTGSEDFDSAKLEFMGLRLANNASDAAMRRAIATAFARRAAELFAPESGGPGLEAAKAAAEAFTAKKGAVKFVREVGVGGEETSQQAEFALALQRALATGAAGKNLEPTRAGVLLAAMLQQLYSLDVLEEEGILEWWADKRGQEGEGMKTVRERCRVLVEWLEQAEEEESEEEEEESEEDEE